MFSGTIIEELLAAVTRAEESVELELRSEEYGVLLPQYSGESALAGVA